MTDEQKVEVIRTYIECYNAFDVEGMLELLNEGIVFENVSDGKVTANANGIDEFRSMAEQGRVLFSEREQVIDEMVTMGEKMVVKIFYTGRLAIDLPNGLKAGQELSLRGTSEFEFADGKIVRLTDIS
ncbi:nuclear transport factor 2 family protein [Planctomycetota bacterium]|nr:nuclear transport factor 2 family protein [Planctomycetota bacterium]